MIAITCIECKKEFKISGAEFEEKKAAGIKMKCSACLAKPVKVFEPKISTADKKESGKNRKK